MNLLIIMATQEKVKGSPFTKVVHVGQEKDRASSLSDARTYPTNMSVTALHWTR